ncbi:hypothetical protein DSO57_1029221 [Entomophthora muscae]|uniref:Uncharacterized protein n=1 Tax=Entomophthora muscae TaxID=34485 RepID=A0ACC2UA79_9FUNG|nr:hypothetical protein DSO57_1029221 [Entomophthora muscae]
MEGSSTTIKTIQGRGHQASVYPANHADIHLADDVFFNIRDTVQERCPHTFNDLYLGVLDYDPLFGQQMMADLFFQMIFNVNKDSQLCKDKCISPQATAFYQPIKPMTYKEYNKLYMATITVNPFSSPPQHQPQPVSLHLIQDLTSQHHLDTFFLAVFCIIDITLPLPKKLLATKFSPVSHAGEGEALLDTSYETYISDGNQEEDKEPEFYRTDEGQLVLKKVAAFYNTVPMPCKPVTNQDTSSSEPTKPSKKCIPDIK